MSHFKLRTHPLILQRTSPNFILYHQKSACLTNDNSAACVDLFKIDRYQTHILKKKTQITRCPKLLQSCRPEIFPSLVKSKVVGEIFEQEIKGFCLSSENGDESPQKKILGDSCMYMYIYTCYIFQSCFILSILVLIG